MTNVEWISVDDALPTGGMEYSCLITDGEEISTGWYEPEYFAESKDEALQYSSDCWHDDSGHLNSDCGGWPQVTHWAKLPSLPRKKRRKNDNV